MAGIDLGIPQLSDVALLGSGGYSDVFVAHHEGLGRRVAVKVVPRMDDPDRLATFERECAAMGRLSDHPNVVVPLSAGATVHGHRYLVLELYPDGSCADMVRTAGPLEPAELREWTRQVGDALRVAHERGVVHNDVKPENILVRSTEGVRHYGVTDFGLAHLLDGRSGGELMAGSLLYVAPELLDGQVPTPASDVYGLAATACFMATGSPPFVRRDDEPWISVVRRIANEPVGTSVLSQIPAPFARAVAGALEKDPRARPSLDDMIAAAVAIDDVPSARLPRLVLVEPAVALANPGGSVLPDAPTIGPPGGLDADQDLIGHDVGHRGVSPLWFAAGLLALFGISVLVVMLFL